jgi:hypothetical protein
MLKFVIRMMVKTVKTVGIIAALSAAMAWASVGGSIAGTVHDPAGRVVAKAGVTVREMNTGIEYKTRTDGMRMGSGVISEPALRWTRARR